MIRMERLLRLQNGRLLYHWRIEFGDSEAVFDMLLSFSRHFYAKSFSKVCGTSGSFLFALICLRSRI